MKAKRGFVIFATTLIHLSFFISPSHQFLGNDIFSSGDERLFPVFCVQSKEELVAIGKTTW
jgi:hypothetical protein